MGEATTARGRPNGNGNGTGRPPEPPTHTPTVEVLDLQHESRIHAELERQMEWALKHPREQQHAIAEALALATVDDETAASCYYTLARKDRESGENKPIEGPSVRLAEILTYTWRHLLVDTRMVALTERFVTSRGACRDLERGNTFAFEVTRRITTRFGKTYSDDMIATTAMAAGSIALRNAIFKVVPSPIWRPVYVKCREMAMGSDKDLLANWKKVVTYFERECLVGEAHLLAWLGIRGTQELQRVHVGRLRGLATAIREGEQSIAEAFADVKIVDMPQRESAAGTVPHPGDLRGSSAERETAASPVPPPPDANVLRPADVQKRENPQGRPYWTFAWRGKTVITFSTTLGAALEQLSMDGTPIDEVQTHDKPDANRPGTVWTYLDSIKPMPAVPA